MKFYLKLLITSIKAATSDRVQCIFDMMMNLGNNMMWFIVWALFFREFKSIGNWHFQQIGALFAVLAASYGMMITLTGGVRLVPHIILSGELDIFLTKPKNLILHLLSSCCFSKGFGDLFGSLIIIVIFGLFTPLSLFVIVFSSICGFITLTSMRLLINSTLFFLGGVEEITERYIDSLMLFSSYPTNIFSGPMRIVTYTILPAAIITGIPVELVISFSWGKMALLLGASLTFMSLATFTFYKGLKHYESGSQFVFRH
jgi:ABC-2 type transport system permease protein